ncbi:MAG: 8-amino-7-oxononanoate synthase [Sphingobacteriales bacterium 17-39-43]|uniref:aminotransferase class I/II-fold pyridoxal phosphate-dependent enzyme n=1 Tax=Daejeonella sp. TaxID=2805397 RepID=UPI000BCEA118|nr:pyridoxal phosphate-dependent aminotransferase family protein [Daejeonella sp.]OYZ29821.1 MAG: 8-amino-7-oxononanoate synthase [Sphingobacteriales bacterium 16-39-50]OZA22705.1 MAG: 8-amino-7-oxononanoate synthase [Sphingobacteriales bacterium 17-39-43]HQT24362.1 pyridoxal phosphate-dependent aminotransferase family protein [Daejeonella sp.]HQT59155.1 pyridoxal phosphate-dependent aminotransferase family protein [Daejeonella sp.]
MKDINTFISESLQQRIKNHSLRTLKPENSLVDFCSNDYLGFSRSKELKALFENELKNYPDYRLGSGGSRLLAGNHSFTESLENKIAIFHDAESAMIYNSGFDANVGLFSSLPQRGDTIISDEYIHASIIDGIRLSHASRFVFRHNNLTSLEHKLKLAKGKIFIVVESVYSMDGDEAPLKEMVKLAKQYNAALIVDEAHAVGIFGDSGRGVVHELGLCNDVFARIITFGKALGTHGAAILGSSQLRSYLINFSRAFIYTTAAPFLNHLAIQCAYVYLKSRDHQSDIHQRIKLFRQSIKAGPKLLDSRSAIQIIVIPGNNKAREAARLIQQEGFDVRAILSPSVAAGSERLRICLHNHNLTTEIKNLCELLNRIL